jgi:uncharacterized protein YukE
MFEKWLKSAYQFDDELTGGGGEEPVSQEPSPEPAREPEAPEPSDTAEPAPTPKPEASAPTHVAAPTGLKNIFAAPPPPPPQPPWQQQPSQFQQPRQPAEQPAPPPKVDFPTEDDWNLDPGKAARQQAQAIEYSNWAANEPIRRELAELKEGFQGSRTAEFQTIVAKVNQAADAGQAAVEKMYAETGPLNADPEFRNNKDLQQAVENIIGACFEEAMKKADQTGDTTQLERISSDPKFPYRVLGLAKADAQSVPEGALRPGRSPVGPQPPAPPRGDGLSAEDAEALAAARADGINLTAADIARARKKTSESIY